MARKIIIKLKESYFENNFLDWKNLTPNDKNGLKSKELERIIDQVNSNCPETIVLDDNVDLYVFDSEYDFNIKT